MSFPASFVISQRRMQHRRGEQPECRIDHHDESLL